MTPPEIAGPVPDPALAGVSARFDDFRGRLVPLRLVDPYGVWVSYHLDDVPDVIHRAEAEARAGGWVAGFVSY